MSSLLLSNDHQKKTESCGSAFCMRVLDVACRQQAMAMELHTAMSLCRLW
jgi:hypothetical protein